MCLGKACGKVAIGTLILFLVQSASAAPSKVSLAPKAKSKPSTSKRIGVGSGYMTFSDQLKVVDGSTVESTTANYAGLVVFAERTWTKNRMLYQLALGVATGKATATNFVVANYPDSGKRTWTLAYFEASANYRLNRSISTGLGIVGGARSTDWKSEANPALTAIGLNKTIYAPEFLLRWNISRRFTLVQSLSTPDFRGTTMWRWTGQFNF